MTTAYLAPFPVAKWFDNNGLPLASGIVTTYAAGTTTPIATYTDSTGSTPNPNPATLNFRGEMPLWLLPNVAYKIAVTDSNGNTIPGYPVDQILNAQLVTLYAGLDTGVQNAILLNFASSVPPNTNGQVLFFIPAFNNTGPVTVNVNGGGVQTILNPSGTQLGANQILAGQFTSIIYLNGIWQLYGGSGVGVNVGTFGAEFPLAAATTTDFGSAPGHNVLVTGNGISITSLGSSAQSVAPIYVGRFSGVNTIVNSNFLVLPGGLNITTQNGDAFIAEYMGGAAWRVLIYQPVAADGGNAQVKASDTAITSSTALTADPALQSNPLQVGQYEVEILLLFDSVTAGAGFAWRLDGTAADSRATLPMLNLGAVNGAAVASVTSPYGATISYATVSTPSGSNSVLYKGTMLVSTAGTLGVKWAQATSTASATTLRAGSYIITTPIGTGANSSATTRIYTTPGAAVETIPAGVNTCVIEVWGGSGGGGGKFVSGCLTAGGGGGGSGGYSRTSVSVTGDAGQTFDYTVGAAGVATGANGGASSVSSGTFSLATLTGFGGATGGSATSISTPGTGGAAGIATGGTAANTTGNAGGAGNNSGGGFGGLGGAGISGINDGGATGGRGGGNAAPVNGGVGIVVFSYS
jgi:hypothetical protein